MAAQCVFNQSGEAFAAYLNAWSRAMATTTLRAPLTASTLAELASTISTQDTARPAIASRIATAEQAGRSCPWPPTDRPVTAHSSGMTAMTSISTRLLGGTRPAMTPVLATGLVK